RRPRLHKRAEAKQSGCGNEAPARHRSLSHYAGHSILIVRTPRKNSTMHALQSFQWHKARYLAVPRSWNASRQHLGFFWIGDPIAVGVGLQLFCDARRNIVARVGSRGGEVLGDWRSGQMLQREFIDTRQVDIEGMHAHFHVGKAGLRCEALQVLFGRDLSRCAEANGGVGRYRPREGGTDGSVIGSHTRPHAQRKTAAVGKHAAHLPQRERFVGKELEALLTKNHVEARIVEPKIKRAALEPFDRRPNGGRERSCDADHSRIEIDTNNASGGTDTLRRDAGDDAGPTSYIQDALARRRGRGVNQKRRPRAEEIASGAALVAFGSLVAQLELLVRGQWFSPRSP